MLVFNCSRLFQQSNDFGQLRFNMSIFLNRLITSPSPIRVVTGRVMSGLGRFQIRTVRLRALLACLTYLDLIMQYSIVQVQLAYFPCLNRSNLFSHKSTAQKPPTSPFAMFSVSMALFPIFRIRQLSKPTTLFLMFYLTIVLVPNSFFFRLPI